MKYLPISILFMILVVLVAWTALADVPVLSPAPFISSSLSLCGGAPSIGTNLDMSACSKSMMLPIGTTGDRPAGSNGMVRYNTTSNSIETYSAGSWISMAPVAQVNSDWTAVSGVSQILHEPILAAVATTGSYTDLINTPTTVPMSFNNTPSHAIQTVAAAGNGWQVSSTRNSLVSYSVLITVTASIASGQSGYIVLEICPTNSSTAANWIEIGRTSSSQIYTLAVALQGVQGAGSAISGSVPAGYYTRLRSVNVTGTPTYSFVSGQEVLL